MPIPRAVGRLNRVGLNRIARRLVPHVPGFGLVLHRGRRSGRPYETPVRVYATPGGVRLALTYGADADWVRNVLAAGGCRLRTGGRTVELTSPQVERDPGYAAVGPIARLILPLLHVADFLDLSGDLSTTSPGRQSDGSQP